jgi:hypothetical protein
MKLAAVRALPRDGESGAGKNYTMGPDGTIVCNDAGYVYNSETDMCEPPAEVEQVLSARIAEPARTFDEILSGVVILRILAKCRVVAWQA